MKFLTKEVKIGIAGIVALGILVYGINYLKGVHLFKPTSYYYVQFQDAYGLIESSPVFADGYQIGIVRDIIYDYSRIGNVLAEIDVEPDLRIPKGSHAELTADMLGGLKMSILLANNPRERMEVGDTIPGRINNGLMEKAAEIIPTVEKMMPKLDSILTALNTLVSSPALPATLNNVQEITANLSATSRQLEKMMSNEVPQLVGNLNTLSNNFITISDNLKGIDYAAAMQKVDETLANVTKITDQLGKKDNTIGLLLNDPTFYNNLSATTANAANLLEDLKNHPKRYVHFSLFGRKEKVQNMPK